MLANIRSCALNGLESCLIDVEVDVASGLPSFEIVGLPDAAVKESKERVRAAIKNSGYEFPPRKMIVNLAPADLKKEGPSFDLPIAVAFLAATGQIKTEGFSDMVFVGELGLDGSLRKTKGILPVALAVRERKMSLSVPEDNIKEAQFGGGEVYGFKDLRSVCDFIKSPLTYDHGEDFCLQDYLEIVDSAAGSFDFCHVKAQKTAKRALEVAAAGAHNVIMSGPPGSGKSFLAKCLPGILPSMTEEEIISVTEIYSVSGLVSAASPVVGKRPFRSPHHTASPASIIGGGRIPMPGEVSLSHKGVLFLDELPEYRRDVLEALREPMEESVVTISRVSAQLTYPADFLLVAAMNPCPCGYYGDSKKSCTCTPHQIHKYRSRVSGPLLDRIDIQLNIPRLEFNEMNSGERAEESSEIRKRVEAAREIQRKRFEGRDITLNSQMGRREIEEFCRLDETGLSLLENAFEKLGLSARAHDRILKTSRTVADLKNLADISAACIAEAIQYRMLDRSINNYY